MEIGFEQISVVVQGPIAGKPTDPPEARQTFQVLRSVRKFLPGAHIILSTWKGSDVEGLDFDELILSDDPGGVDLGYKGRELILNNINRQIVSTVAGLKAVKTKYCIKTRTDVIFESAGFLKFFGLQEPRDPSWSFFKERVVTANIFARNPRTEFKLPFHPCDFFMFGLSEDVLDLWDIPLQPKIYSRWTVHLPVFMGGYTNLSDVRYFPEQYLWLSWLQKHGVSPNVRYYADVDDELIETSEQSFASNIVIADAKAVGISWLKQSIEIKEAVTFYNFEDWNEMVRKYVAGAPANRRIVQSIMRQYEYIFHRVGRVEAIQFLMTHTKNAIVVVLVRVFWRAPRKILRMIGFRGVSSS